MGWLSFGNDPDRVAKEYATHSLQAPFDVSVETVDGELLEITPYKHNDGIDAGANLLQALHDVRIRDGKNVSDAHAFEIWFDRGEFTFRLYAANPRARERFQRRTTNTYTNSEVVPIERGKAFPRLNPGDHVAGGFLTLEDHTFLPIRHHNAEGFQHGDPYSDIMGEMLSLDDSVVVVQALFKPADREWTRHGPNGESVDDVAAGLRQGTVESLTNLSAWNPFREIETRDPSEKDKQAAKIVEQQRGEQGFHVNIRLLAASPSPREARERARGVGSMFAKYYNASTEQGLDHHPIEPSKDTMHGLLADIIERRWEGSREMILSIDELAGVAHIPNADIEVPQIPWKTTQTGSQIAANAEKDQATSATPRGESAHEATQAADEPTQPDSQPTPRSSEAGGYDGWAADDER